MTQSIQAQSTKEAPPLLRPPAIPLVTHSPYFSIWCPADKLTDTWSTHWTGATQAMCGLIRVDGETYRFLGPQPDGVDDLPALEQMKLEVLPTETIATFKASNVTLKITFCSPLLPNDLKVMASPVTYVTCDVLTEDGSAPDVQVYLDLCAEATVNKVDQVVETKIVDFSGFLAARAGSREQPVLKRKGDSVRIDWGYAYLAAAKLDSDVALTTGDAAIVRQQFATSGQLPKTDAGAAKPANDGWPVIAASFAIGKLRKEGNSRTFMLAYDEIQPVQYLGESLDPLWRAYHDGVGAMLTSAAKEADARKVLAGSFGNDLMKDLAEAGGEKYAALCALAYRQAIAGHGLALGENGQTLMFSKENSSNGCIGTVDVIYPTAPLFLLLSPKLMEANLEPVLRYAAMDRWKFPFAPHDLGTYPLANGQVYGGGEKTEENQMPVEESANMLILFAALEKSLDVPTKLVETHRALLKKWADYLLEKGLDPENQLCTDDFAGHLAHNANLSIKAVLGIAAYGQICQNHEDRAEGKVYLDKAGAMAARWIEMAADGDHTKLAFDKPGTWSQKYNLVWDRILGLNLFPPGVAQQEVAFYLKTQEKYGIALDNRSKWTKLDWILWSASLATNPADFEALVNPVYRFANETPDRVPLSDWYFVDSGKHKQFRARTVVGGVFIKMLTDETRWRTWSGRARSE